MSGLFTAPASMANTQWTNAANEAIATQTNQVNAKMNAETNEVNRRNVEATNAANIEIANRTNQANMAINQANIDYQNAYNQQIFEREDTSWQRAARDASAIGINPLALSGGASAGGQASAPQATLGMQTGAAMQASHAQAARFERYENKAADLSGLGNVLSELNQLSTGMAQRDLLTAQAQRAENENKFFDEHGYFPQQVSDMDKLATALESIFSGQGFYSDVAKKGEEWIKDKANKVGEALGWKSNQNQNLTTSKPVSGVEMNFEQTREYNKKRAVEIQAEIQKAQKAGSNYFTRGLQELKNLNNEMEYENTKRRGYVNGY